MNCLLINVELTQDLLQEAKNKDGTQGFGNKGRVGMAITQLTVRDLLLQTGLGSHRRERLMAGD